MDKVLVIGGGGFLGSHVADALSEAGYSVVVFDTAESVHLRSDQQMIVGDIMDLEQVVPAAEGTSAVFHFAAIADIDEARNRPVDTARINTLGTVHALEAAVRNNVDRFVIASTVYVNSREGSFYRASKQGAEAFVEAYQERYGLPFTILRYGSLYGKRADRRNGIYRMLHEALTEGRITYRGSGEAIREYIHAGDAARMTVKVLEEQYKNRRLVLTGQERLRIHDVMCMIAEIMHQDLELRYEEGGAGHYHITPYTYDPKTAHKMIPTDHVDLAHRAPNSGYRMFMLRGSPFCGFRDSLSHPHWQGMAHGRNGGLSRGEVAACGSPEAFFAYRG